MRTFATVNQLFCSLSITLVTTLVTTLAATLSITQCEQLPEKSPTTPKVGFNLDLRSKTYLAIAATDQGYTSSSLYLKNLATGDYAEILQGESGDPFLALRPLSTAIDDGAELLWFNRRASQKNFRRINITKNADASISKQFSLALVATGDPSHVASIDDRTLVLSGFAGGQIYGLATVNDAETLTPLIDPETPWGLPKGQPLRPAMTLPTTLGARRILVVAHQGIGSRYEMTGSQSLFLLSYVAQPVIAALPLDLDTTAQGVQGIPLKFNNPQLMAEDASCANCVAVASTCYNRKDCQEGLEIVDLQAAVSQKTIAWPLPPTCLANGTPVMGQNSRHIFISVTCSKKQNNSNELLKGIYSISYETRNATLVHKFASEANGFYMLHFDKSENLLFVGDETAKHEGILAVYRLKGNQGQSFEKIGEDKMPLIPNAGVTF